MASRTALKRAVNVRDRYLRRCRRVTGQPVWPTPACRKALRRLYRAECDARLMRRLRYLHALGLIP